MICFEASVYYIGNSGHLKFDSEKYLFCICNLNKRQTKFKEKIEHTSESAVRCLVGISGKCENKRFHDNLMSKLKSTK